MAKNFVGNGAVLTMTAPVGGVVSGVPIKIGALVLVPLVNAMAGESFSGRADGVWRLPADAGLTAGALVKWDAAAGKLVADTAKDADDFGKLVTAESGGYAEARLSN